MCPQEKPKSVNSHEFSFGPVIEETQIRDSGFRTKKTSNVPGGHTTESRGVLLRRERHGVSGMGCGNSKSADIIVEPIPPSKHEVVVETPVKAPVKAAPTKPAPTKPAAKPAAAPAGGKRGPVDAAATGTNPTVASVNLSKIASGDAPGSYNFTPRAAPTPRFIPFQASPTEYGSKVFTGEVANQVHGCCFLQYFAQASPYPSILQREPPSQKRRAGC